MRGRIFRRSPRLAIVLGLLALVVAGTAIAIAPQRPYDLTFTAKSESEIQNIDVVRAWLKNYYGAPTAVAGTTGTWNAPLTTSSNYAAEAESVAADGTQWLNAHKPKNGERKAIVLDVDDTSLTTWNFELYSNWIFDPVSNGVFVGLTNGVFTGNAFPATPGMVDMATQAKAMGYAVFFVTGRGDAQHKATIANLVDDAAVGDPVNYPNIDNLTISGKPIPEVDAHYPMPTAVDTGHGGFADGLFTKPAISKGPPVVNNYPAYLNKPEFCAAFIAALTSCPTTRYKSGTRAYIESLGYDIVANFGDQFNDLDGGFADKTFKMPNPNYYLTG